MTQRIFDVDNPQDVKDLFDIFPNGVKKIYKYTPTNEIKFYDKDGEYIDSCSHIRVNWHGKTEITRPVDETQWVGCLCWFWDKDAEPCIGVMKRIDADAPYKYTTTDGYSYKNCRPVHRDEVKFVEDVE